MTRRVPDIEAQLADAQPLAGHHLRVGRRQRASLRLGEPEPRHLVRHGVVERPVRGMEPDRCARLARHARHAQDVIEVRVRQPDRDGSGARFLHLVQDQPGLFPRIDDGAFTRLLIDDEVAVLRKHAVGNLDDLHLRAMTLPSVSRSDLRYFSTAMAAVVASPTAVVIWRVT